MKTPLEVFDDYYAPDDAWAQKCRADLAAALALLGAPSTPEGARLIAAAPRMLALIQSMLYTLTLGAASVDSEWCPLPPHTVTTVVNPLMIADARALLRDLHGDPQ